MEINPKDTYTIMADKSLSSSDIDILMTLYQPLVMGDGILLYLTLYAESKNVHANMTHARLFTFMNPISSDTFLRARMRLEAYGLLKTYIKASQSENSYLYSLQMPMSGSDFFASFYAKEYLQLVGKKIFNENANKYMRSFSDWQEYKEVSVQMNHQKENDLDYSVHYQKMQPKLSFSNDDSDISFDYNRFITITSALVFPIELRTQENMALIGRLATVHGISADKMQILVSKCCNLDHLQFNSEKLKVLCERAQPDITKAKDPYTLPPVSFLQSKQNGASVSLTDKKIIEHLSIDMHFSNEVINIMLEHILKVSNNQLREKFVYMVAGEWARDGVNNREKALAECNKKISSGNAKPKVSVSVPDYMIDQNTGKIADRQPASADLIRDIQNNMKKMGGKHG